MLFLTMGSVTTVQATDVPAEAWEAARSGLVRLDDMAPVEQMQIHRPYLSCWRRSEGGDPIVCGAYSIGLDGSCLYGFPVTHDGELLSTLHVSTSEDGGFEYAGRYFANYVDEWILRMMEEKPESDVWRVLTYSIGEFVVIEVGDAAWMASISSDGWLPHEGPMDECCTLIPMDDAYPRMERRVHDWIEVRDYLERTR